MAGKTPAVRNIEKAYSRAGASDNSTAGSASRLGSQSQESSEGYSGQGVGSRKFGERIGGQRGEVSLYVFFGVGVFMLVIVVRGGNGRCEGTPVCLRWKKGGRDKRISSAIHKQMLTLHLYSRTKLESSGTI